MWMMHHEKIRQVVFMLELTAFAKVWDVVAKMPSRYSLNLTCSIRSMKSTS
jgi:hypothetical protein